MKKEDSTWPNFQRIINLFTQKIVTKLSKIWVWDPGSGKNLFRIPDPGVKKAPDPGSGSATLVNILDRFVDVQRLSFPKIIILQGVLWIRIRIRIGSGFNGIPGSASGFEIRIRIRIYNPFPYPDSLKMLDPDPYPD